MSSPLKFEVENQNLQLASKKPATVHLTLSHPTSFHIYTPTRGVHVASRSKGVPTQVPVSKAQDEERGKENPTARVVNVHKSQIGR